MEQRIRAKFLKIRKHNLTYICFANLNLITIDGMNICLINTIIDKKNSRESIYTHRFLNQFPELIQIKTNSSFLRNILIKII